MMSVHEAIDNMPRSALVHQRRIALRRPRRSRRAIYRRIIQSEATVEATSNAESG
jgi:hypothetical protein